MKIAVDCRLINASGMGVYLENLLACWISNKADSFFLFGKKNQIDRYYKYDNVELFEYNVQTFSVFNFILAPISKINDCNAYFSPTYNYFFGIKVPVYSTIHDVRLIENEFMTSKIDRIFRKIIIFFMINRSTRIFTVSEFSKNRILFHFKIKKPIDVVYHGIPFELKNHVIASNPIYQYNYICYVGNIKWHKGLKILISAFQQLKKEGYKKKLLLIGKLDDNSSEAESLNSLQLSGDILYLGELKTSEVYDVMAYSDCLIQPSLYEGFGIPPLESLYLGVPAIISDIPVFQEVYKYLPVIFYNHNSADDLAEKLRVFNKEEEKTKINKDTVIKMYDFNKTASRIMEIIKADL